MIGQIDPSQAKEWLTESNYTVAGVLLVIFVCFGLAVWRVISWIGREFVIPGRDRMFRHLDRVDDTMKDVSTSLQKLATVPERLDGIEEKVESISLRVKQIDANIGHDGGPRK